MPILDPFEDIVQFHRPRGFESRFMAYRVGAWNLPSGAGTRIPFNTRQYDTLTEFDVAAPNYYFTPTSTGWYHFDTNVVFGVPGAGGYIQIQIIGPAAINEVAGIRHDIIAATTQLLSCSGDVYLTVGQTVYIEGFQNTGFNLALAVGLVNSKFTGHRFG